MVKLCKPQAGKSVFTKINTSVHHLSLYSCITLQKGHFAVVPTKGSLCGCITLILQKVLKIQYQRKK